MIVSNNPIVMDRIYHDESLLEDKTTPDYKTAFAICSIMDVIEQLESEPDKENIDYDFYSTRFHIRGINEEFLSEQQAVEYTRKMPVNSKNGVTYHITQVLKGTITQTYPYCTFHMTSPQEKKE